MKDDGSGSVQKRDEGNAMQVGWLLISGQSRISKARQVKACESQDDLGLARPVKVCVRIAVAKKKEK